MGRIRVNLLIGKTDPISAPLLFDFQLDHDA